MKLKNKFFQKNALMPIIISIFFSLNFCLFAPSPTFAKQRLMMGATSTSSGMYTYMVAASTVINKLPDLMLTVVETGGTVDNLKRLERGDVDFALIASDKTGEAFSGTGALKGFKNSKLRILWYWSAYPWNIVVSEKSEIKTLQDLDNKSISPGGRGTATEKTMEDMFDFLGIKPDYYRAGMADAVNAMKDRRIVGFVKAGAPPDSTVQNIGASMPIRLLNFDTDLIDKLQKQFPFMLSMEIPANSYKGQKELIRCVGAAVGVGGNSTLSTDLVYSMIKTIWENHGEISNAYPAVKKEHTLKLTVKAADIPLHSGTIKYLKEKGIEIPERLMPPEYLK